jgi:hypothetical protein
MTCSDVQRALPEIMDANPNVEFQAHLKTCAACSELVSDLELIASEAKHLAAIAEPPARLWVKIAAAARAEGIIREPELASARLVPRSGMRRRWSVWWLAPVAAVLLVAGAYLSTHSSVQQVADQNQPSSVSTSSVSAVVAAKDSTPSKAADRKPVQMAAKRNPKSIDRSEPAQNAPMTTVSTEDNQVLNRIGRQSPDMRATFESQLKAVNAYIRDAESYLKQNPDDEEVRQQLMDAYDQKAMLYQMALDNVQ